MKEKGATQGERHEVQQAKNKKQDTPTQMSLRVRLILQSYHPNSPDPGQKLGN